MEYQRLLKITSPLMQGEDIRIVQQKLMDLNYNIGKYGADGYYGTSTKDAIVEFQKDNKLDIDGIVGIKTWNKLFHQNEGVETFKRVFIDAGHGGSDFGAVGFANEKEVVLAIALKLGALLEEKNIEVFYSRKLNNTNVGLTERAEMANKALADLFISIHANSNEGIAGTGTEVFVHPNASQISNKIALEVVKNISMDLEMINRGVKKADFVVLRKTSMPSILVETGFVNHKVDSEKLKNRQYDFAKAIFRACSRL